MLISKRKYLLVFLVLIVISVVVLYIFSRPRTATLVIESIPQAQVYIDGELKGTTPQDIEVEQGELLLKIEANMDSDRSYSSYETRVKTVSGTKTIVRRILEVEEEKASGEIISFEKSRHNSTDFSIISIPDGAQIFIDNKFTDLSPLKVTDLSPGVHDIEIRAQGYISRQFKIQIIEGFNLTAIVDLAKITESSALIPANLAQQQINDKDTTNKEDVVKLKILSTPTTYLRVRELATTNSREIGQVRPGQTYEYLQTSEDGEWYQIQFKEELKGWISREYSQILDSGSSTGSGV